MNGRIILHECRRRGVTIYVENGDIQMHGPLTDGLIACIKSRKAELIGLLSDPNLVHFGMHLVHKPSPLSRQSGLGKWTRLEAETRGKQGVEGEREIERIQFSPVSPVRPRTYTPRASNFLSPPVSLKIAEIDGNEGGENKSSTQPSCHPQESGLTGLSGLGAFPAFDWDALPDSLKGIDNPAPSRERMLAAFAATQGQPPDLHPDD